MDIAASVLPATTNRASGRCVMARNTAAQLGEYFNAEDLSE